MQGFRGRAMSAAAALGLALAVSAGPSLAQDKGVSGAEVAPVALPPPPTAWYATKPAGAAAGPVTAAQLAQNAGKTTWLHYGGDYRNFRHSPVASLTPASVKRLHVAWSAPTGTTGQFEASPVVYGGVMYVSSSYNRLLALDAKTGEILWRYDVQLPSDLRLCCGPANRGVAIGGDLVIMATLDAKLIAFDRKTGKVAWNVTLADYKEGYSSTAAPMIVGETIYTGIAGGEFGAPGFIDAYDLKTGKRVWRRMTVPTAAGQPGADTWAGDSWKSGGSPTWNTGAYDKETNTLFWTVGNPSPDWNGDKRAGDNLYSDSVLALDPATGKLKWHFQFTPHDVWDYDGNTQLFLVDTAIGGKPVKAIVQPNRNGYFYVLDRATGRFLRATQYIEQLNWATIDAKGRPVVNPKAMPQDNPRDRICPSNLGGMNGSWTGAYDPATGLVYAPTIEACQQYAKGIAVYVKGIPFMGGAPNTVDANEGKAYGVLAAVDVKSGKVKWRYHDPRPMMSGVVATAGGVLFTANQEGQALALDQATGKKLWSFRIGGGGRGQPIVYEVDGKPYVAIPSGGWAGLDSFAGAASNLPEGGQLFVFSLN
jgi:alcohol dehydrogenase (cytochrome c)